MKVRLTNPAAAADLSKFLRSRADAVVDQRAPGVLEVSLLGSYNDQAMRAGIDDALRRWSFIRQQPASNAAVE